MARARNLKPGFFRDAKVVACSFESRLLFQGLWCLADYMGRLKYVPVEIKMEVFPADNVDIEKHMRELEQVGLIQMYQDHSGTALVQIVGFTKHQNPHINERMDKDKNPLPHLPGPNDCKPAEGEEKPTEKQKVEDALRVLREYSDSNPADSLNLIPPSLKESSPRKRGCRIPEGWQPSDELKQWAITERPGLDLKRVVDSFTDYWKAKTGQQATKLDWDATFRNWVRNEKPNGTHQTGSRPSAASRQDAAAARAAATLG